MNMYVLERRILQGRNTPSQYLWQQYAICGTRRPLERVRLGLSGTKEWRIRKIATAGRTVDRVA